MPPRMIPLSALMRGMPRYALGTVNPPQAPPPVNVTHGDTQENLGMTTPQPPQFQQNNGGPKPPANVLASANQQAATTGANFMSGLNKMYQNSASQTPPMGPITPPQTPPSTVNVTHGDSQENLGYPQPPQPYNPIPQNGGPYTPGAPYKSWSPNFSTLDNGPRGPMPAPKTRQVGDIWMTEDEYQNMVAAQAGATPTAAQRDPSIPFNPGLGPVGGVRGGVAYASQKPAGTGGIPDYNNPQYFGAQPLANQMARYPRTPSPYAAWQQGNPLSQLLRRRY